MRIAPRHRTANTAIMRFSRTPEMTYKVVIPQKYVEKLAEFGGYFEESIRKQILQALENYINGIETELMAMAA